MLGHAQDKEEKRTLTSPSESRDSSSTSARKIILYPLAPVLLSFFCHWCCCSRLERFSFLVFQGRINSDPHYAVRTEPVAYLADVIKSQGSFTPSQSRHSAKTEAYLEWEANPFTLES